MTNLVLRSKKGKEVSTVELLNSLVETNKAGGLSIHYVDGKPTLQFKSNQKGALSVITASVLFPMLLTKFEIEKSLAYQLAGWLSENLGGTKVNPPAVEQQKAVETKETAEQFQARVIALLETLNKKSTKAEMLDVIFKVQTLTIKEE